MITLAQSGGGLYSDWFVNQVTITKTPNNHNVAYNFPCYRWVATELVVFEGKGSYFQIFLSMRYNKCCLIDKEEINTFCFTNGKQMV